MTDFPSARGGKCEAAVDVVLPEDLHVLLPVVGMLWREADVSTPRPHPVSHDHAVEVSHGIDPHDLVAGLGVPRTLGPAGAVCDVLIAFAHHSPPLAVARQSLFCSSSLRLVAALSARKNSFLPRLQAARQDRPTGRTLQEVEGLASTNRSRPTLLNHRPERRSRRPRSGTASLPPYAGHEAFPDPHTRRGTSTTAACYYSFFQLPYARKLTCI